MQTTRKFVSIRNLNHLLVMGIASGPHAVNLCQPMFAAPGPKGPGKLGKPGGKASDGFTVLHGDIEGVEVPFDATAAKAAFITAAVFLIGAIPVVAIATVIAVKVRIISDVVSLGECLLDFQRWYVSLTWSWFLGSGRAGVVFRNMHGASYLVEVSWNLARLPKG